MAKTRKTKSASAVVKRKRLEIQPSTIRKILQLAGYDPKLYDSFSKKQKAQFSAFDYYLPVFRIKKNSSMPRHYIKYIREKVYDFLDSNYVGDESIQLTMKEFATFGLGGFCILQRIMATKEINDKWTEEITDEIYPFCEKTLDMLQNILRLFVLSFSKVTFRTYSFSVDLTNTSCNNKNGFCWKWIIEFTSTPSYKQQFIRNGKSRPAYLCHTGRTNQESATPLMISDEEIYPDIISDKVYPVFIQSHVLHRIKERFDTLPAPSRNMFMMGSFIFQQKFIYISPETILIPCNIAYNIPAGYFTFSIQDDSILILTLLPLTSIITPEGKKLYDILGLSKSELIYLGMDKLSFYEQVDFDQIPVLKEALIQSGIWKMRQCLLENKEEVEEIIEPNKERTYFVKAYFEKRTQRMESLAQLM
ncbi:hypothetical protein LJB92_03250 [Bacteroidales bacterium OttesenSCG-928-M06]|nr:hypothetical protein [Bacteroidales bacterium OttesenSCG-928-M06]